MSAMASQITSLTIVYSKPRVTGRVTGEFPAQRASNAENISIWWRHHDAWIMTVITLSFFPLNGPGNWFTQPLDTPDCLLVSMQSV